MLKEFAFSLSNRHYFQDASKISDWMNLNSDTFMSLYDYDEAVVDYFTNNKRLSGFDGNIYMPDEFILDVDGSNYTNAQEKAQMLCKLLGEKRIPHKIFFSGTGFHMNISSDAFRWNPSPNLHMLVKKELTKHGIFKFADSAVTDKIRIIRVANTRNSKSNLYKVQVSGDMLFGDINDILEYAKKPQKLVEITLDCDPVFDCITEIKEETPKVESINQGRQADPVNYPCISKMLESNPVGQRHTVALRLAAWFRWLYPESTVRTIMEKWRQQVDNPNSRFTEKEMENIVSGCYEGHNGSGYRYGCSDPVMDEYCRNTCRLYKSKKSQDTMDSFQMEEAFIDFQKSGITPINIGALYGQDFPVYPGEVVIIQAPPKSMKTMLLQNWMNTFKKPTYFIEMEMSPRQIWSRFVQMEMNWSEEQLMSHYKSMKNGMDKKFEWLMADFSAPYPNELERRLAVLPQKPEIVVVDHMGLFKSKHKDNNMKVEEASQALSELAVRHNLIVITVSEITKQAFHEGMNMASTKGSFRTVYNTNKLLSVTPFKDPSTKLIKALKIKCEANREREDLDVLLRVENTRIYYEKETYGFDDGSNMV